MRILDSHVHLWDPAVLHYDWLDGRLLRRFGPDERKDALASAVDAQRACIFVQAECVPDDSLAEVDWVSGLAADMGVRGIVARLAMEDGDHVVPRLFELRERWLVVGVRRLIQDESPGFATSDAFLAAARAVADAGYTFDACVRHTQLAEIARLADAVPRLRIVLDHLGKPAVAAAPSESWLTDLHAVAERPQVVCKLSGLPAETSGAWTPERFTPFLDAALDAFGPQRLLFGGDWPVSFPYADWEACVLRWVTASAPEHVDDIMWGNAVRTYGVRQAGDS